ncbi:MAG: exosome complex protein Rrp42 [Desulfurococcales archaeon]|nr:exosome complex protein Rrp42 [Desulfurococcales archaeon]
MSMSPFKLSVVPSLKKEAFMALYKKGLRVDDRDLYTPRRITIETGVIEKAEGSALVKLGNTQVLAGVKADIGTPFRDTPNQGVLTVHAEFVPLASPMFEPGPPDDNAIELARVIDRSIRESHAVDLESLAIIPGEKVWILWVDLYILDHDGNLFDASMLATMAALKTTRLPDYEEYETGDIVVLRDKPGEPVKVKRDIVSVTTAKIGNYIIVDPSFEEEVIADTRMVLSFDRDGNIVGAQKTGDGGLTPKEFDKMVNISLRASKVYFKSLDEALGTGAGDR